MSKVVWDASVPLAILLQEPLVSMQSKAEDAVISAVSLAEIRSKLSDLGRIDLIAAEERLRKILRVAAFTAEQAILAGDLRAPTKAYGLSLGDRACLALAISLDADVYTADRQWQQVQVGCRIHLIR